jgi:hypothetical protein
MRQIPPSNVLLDPMLVRAKYAMRGIPSVPDEVRARSWTRCSCHSCAAAVERDAGRDRARRARTGPSSGPRSDRRTAWRTNPFAPRTVTRRPRGRRTTPHRLYEAPASARRVRRQAVLRRPCSAVIAMEVCERRPASTPRATASSSNSGPGDDREQVTLRSARPSADGRVWRSGLGPVLGDSDDAAGSSVIDSGSMPRSPVRPAAGSTAANPRSVGPMWRVPPRMAYEVAVAGMTASLPSEAPSCQAAAAVTRLHR